MYAMQRRLLNFVEKALVEDVIPILVVAFHCQLNQLVSQCIQRVARSDLDNVSLEKELPCAVSSEIKSLSPKPQPEAILVLRKWTPYMKSILGESTGLWTLTMLS
jgi:hypothetical protein